MTDSAPHKVQRFYLHYPAGHRAYLVVVDNQRHPFDFSDNSFKPASELDDLRDACLYATERLEERAEHGYSYSVEFDLARLLAGSNPESIPAEGCVISVHWLVQVGDEPDVKVDHQRDDCRLRLVAGSFEPVDTGSRDQLDETIAFAKRVKHAEEYREFVLREIDTQDLRRQRLSAAVQAADVAATLRVLAEDLCNWAGNLKHHMLHQISHLAKDPSFVNSRMVPEDAPFRVYETWAVRDWIGSHEAYDLLEFHKSSDFARSFSARVDRLHEARVEFSRNVVEYTAQTRGEDVEGIFVLDEARKKLKHMTICLARYIDVIASQFEAARSPKAAPADQSRPAKLSANQSSKAGDSDSAAPETTGASERPPVEPASDEILRLALPLAVMSAAGLRDLVRIRYYYPNVIPEEEAKSLHEGFAANLKSAAELCQLERVFEIGKIPTFEEGGSDAELSVVMGALSVWHPDTKGDPSAQDVAKTMDAAIARCQEDATEPVRSMIERVINAMLYDCRVPMPKGDPSYEEPQRFVQMLRSYWAIVRQLVLHHIESPASFRPHPLMPLVVNLKARIDDCFDRLTQLKDAADVRQTVTTLVEVVLSGEPDDLQAVPDWSYDQVTSVDRFIEEGRLVLGAKSYPITPAEEMCLSYAQTEVQRYEEQVKLEWSKILRRMDANREARPRQTSDSPEKKTPSEPQTNPAETPARATRVAPQQFSGGEIVFFEDRVELCGVDICRGSRSITRRRVLECLARTDKDGKFVSYSLEQLTDFVKPKGGQGTIVGAIRDLRDQIIVGLRQRQSAIVCGRRDVILSGGPGYRFAECVSVQFADQPSSADITDIDGSEDAPNVPDEDVRDAFVVLDDAAARRGWVLHHLANGVELKAPMLAEQFKCSVKTAQRDLTALKDEGKIEYVGASRTGYYRLCQPPPSDS